MPLGLISYFQPERCGKVRIELRGGYAVNAAVLRRDVICMAPAYPSSKNYVRIISNNPARYIWVRLG